MNKRIIYILLVSAFVFFLTALFIYFKTNKSTEVAVPKQQTPDIEQKTEAPESLPLKAFYFREDSWFMVPMDFELKQTGNKTDLYRDFLDYIIRKREGFIVPVPDGLGVRSLYYVETTDLLVIDFDEQLLTNFPGGSRGELEFIYFIVNNLCFNFKEIKRVKFMVSGNEFKTIGGHINMENPFFPDFNLLNTD